MATQFEIDCALMAGASYLSNRDPINRFPVPQGWAEKIELRARNDSSGFEAASFQNTTNPNNIVISFAGTNATQLSDWTSGNVPLAVGVVSDQLKQAVDYYLQVRKDNPNANITFTGHSLGGGIAALMGVFFGKQAVTFDQAPFANTAEQGLFGTASGALDLQTYLLGKSYTDPAMVAVRDTAASDLSSFLHVQQNIGGIPNSDLVSTFRVAGEFTSSFPVGTLFDPIGAPATFIQHGPTNISAFTELHAQSLLAAFLQSQQTAATGKALNDVTYKLTDLLGMIFDGNLFAHPTNDPKFENLLEHLVQQQTAASDPAIGMVSRFNSDLWKLAQDGGLTLNEAHLSRALTAFAMQKYYDETQAGAGYNKTLFNDVSGGIRFDIQDVAVSAAAAKGYADFALFLKEYYTTLDVDGYPVTSPDKNQILAALPGLRDWYIQAGSSGMNAADTLNRGAFMLGGAGIDTLTGGAKADLLVGNAGDDVLNGGQGSDVLIGGSGADTYAWQAGQNAGIDTVLDSDNTGYLRDDTTSPIALTGGNQYGDNRVFRGTDANGNNHLYTFVTGDRAAGGDLIVDGAMLIKGYKPNAGNGMGLALGDAVQQNTQPNITGDLAPIDADPSAAGVQTQTDALGNVIVDPATPQPGRGDWLYGSTGADVIEGKDGSDVLDGKDGDDRLYAGTQISAATAIALGNIPDSGSNQTGDWLNGGAGADTLTDGAGNCYVNSRLRATTRRARPPLPRPALPLAA